MGFAVDSQRVLLPERTIRNREYQYYGKHKFILPNRESTRVILLEYIEGITPDQLQDKYPIHSPRYNPLLKESYTKWIEIAKEHYVPAVRGICAIAERRLVHRDLKAQHIMITSMSPWQVVYIDFALRDPIRIEASELLLSEK
ncbi:hypothetical protein ARMGADRAFT_1087149 [Armillaria gallica]|uniref:Protein kinase domain-containing protein n=1 Tax=Armillaria gallica TaxID=47427 RepID=A0A2H3DC79_ARMGA|nr:hypothetical protein ARMGADRAFT_1087149 [Armillaria gallica]